MSFLKRAWKGEAKLWIVFWGGMVFQQVLAIISGFVVGLFGAAYAQGAGMDKAATHVYVQSLIDSPPFLGLLFASFLVICISIWRCAWNASSKLWGYLARVFVVIILICVLMALVSKLGNQQKVVVVNEQNLNGIQASPAFDGVRHE